MAAVQPVRQNSKAVLHIKFRLRLHKVTAEIADEFAVRFVSRFINPGIRRTECTARFDKERQIAASAVGIAGFKLPQHIRAPELACGIGAMHRKLQRIHIQAALVDLINQCLHIRRQHLHIPVVNERFGSCRAEIVDGIAVGNGRAVRLSRAVLPEHKEIVFSVIRCCPRKLNLPFRIFTGKTRNILYGCQIKLRRFHGSLRQFACTAFGYFYRQNLFKPALLHIPRQLALREFSGKHAVFYRNRHKPELLRRRFLIRYNGDKVGCCPVCTAGHADAHAELPALFDDHMGIMNPLG